MLRHIVGGRKAVVAASMLVTVGSVLPVTSVRAAEPRTAHSSCARVVRATVDVLQPRDLAGACVSASTSRVRATHAPQVALPTTPCVPIPMVNDRCPTWTQQPPTEPRTPILVASSGPDGRLYWAGSGSNGLEVDAFDHNGNHLWTNVRKGVTFSTPGSTTTTTGDISPVAAATSPDGTRLYVLSVMTISQSQSGCGHEGLLVAYHATTGEAAWAASDDGVPQACSEFWTSMAVDAARVYVTGGSTIPSGAGLSSFVNTGETEAYDTRNGARLWWVTSPRAYGYSGSSAPYRFDGGLENYGNPIIEEATDGGDVFVLSYVYDLNQDLSQTVFESTAALSSTTGAALWSSKRNICPSCSNGEPGLLRLLAATDDSHLYVVNGTDAPDAVGGQLLDESIVALDAHSGRAVWTTDLGNAVPPLLDWGPGWMGIDPATAMVYLYSNGTSGVAPFVLSAYRTADGSQAWSTDLTVSGLGGSLGAANRYNPSFLPDGTQLFVGETVIPAYAQEAELVAFDARTGSVSWRAWLGPGIVSAVAAGGGQVAVAANGLWGYSAS